MVRTKNTRTIDGTPSVAGPWWSCGDRAESIPGGCGCSLTRTEAGRPCRGFVRMLTGATCCPTISGSRSGELLRTFMGLAPTVGKYRPRRDTKGSGAVTRHKKRPSGSNNHESAGADGIPAIGRRLGDAGTAILQGAHGDRRGCPPGAFPIATGKGMVLPLVPARRGGRHWILGPPSAPGTAPAAVWNEVCALAPGRRLCRGTPGTVELTAVDSGHIRLGEAGIRQRRYQG